MKEIFDENYALKAAIHYASQSKCQSKRGVVVWSRKTGLLSGGWNAPPKPFECDGSDKCRANCAKTAVHAEQMAILDYLTVAHLVRNEQIELLHVKVVDGQPVFSEKPSCWQCSKLILASLDIKTVWLYQKEGLVKYHALDFHTQTLKNCGLDGETA